MNERYLVIKPAKLGVEPRIVKMLHEADYEDGDYLVKIQAEGTNLRVTVTETGEADSVGNPRISTLELIR